jgi:hypothetical protein
MMKYVSLITCLILSFSASVQAQTLTIENGATVTIDGDNNGGTVFDVRGDVDIQSGGNLDLVDDGKLIVGGSFSVNNASGFDPDDGTIEFNGTGSTQQINLLGSGFVERFYNCIINSSAGVEIIANSSSSTLYINNILTPQSGTLVTNGDLLLRSSRTIQARVAYGTGTISGITRVEKQLNSAFADWRQMGFPVEIPTTTNAGNTHWNTFTNRLSILLDGYSPANRINTYVWNATDADGAGTGDDLAFGWEPATDATDETNAFSIFLSNNTANLPYHSFGSSSDEEQFEIDGQLNSGDYAYNLAYTRDPSGDPATNPGDNIGWNFIPNKWPAYVDVAALITGFAADNAGNPAVYQAIHVWDATNVSDNAGQYRAILGNGVSKINYNTLGNDLSAANQNLDMFQAFWVKATGPNQVLNLTASNMQTTDFQGEQFLKKEFETIRLNVFDQDSMWDQLVIYFHETSTRDFDLNGDAYYLPSQNEQVPVLYAIEGPSKASIVSRQANTTDSVQVVFGSLKSQSKFHIHADLDALGEGWYVYLRDKKTNQTYPLNHDQSLDFSHFNGLATQRFIVYFSKRASAFNHLVTGAQREIISFVRNNRLTLQSNGIGGQATISVFDATGRILYNDVRRIPMGEEIKLEIAPANQLLMVRVVASGNVFHDKVFY